MTHRDRHSSLVWKAMSVPHASTPCPPNRSPSPSVYTFDRSLRAPELASRTNVFVGRTVAGRPPERWSAANES